MGWGSGWCVCVVVGGFVGVSGGVFGGWWGCVWLCVSVGVGVCECVSVSERVGV